MSESSTTRIAGVGPFGQLLAVWLVGVILLVFGGQFRSLILIGVGSVMLFGSIIWINGGVQVLVRRSTLPFTVATCLLVSGLYFRNTLVQWAGLLLVLGWGFWSVRSDVRAFIDSGDRNDG